MSIVQHICRISDEMHYFLQPLQMSSHSKSFYHYTDLITQLLGHFSTLHRPDYSFSWPLLSPYSTPVGLHITQKNFQLITTNSRPNLIPIAIMVLRLYQLHSNPSFRVELNVIIHVYTNMGLYRSQKQLFFNVFFQLDIQQ